MVGELRKGKITGWNLVRQFGFISPEDGGNEILFHASEFEPNVSPQEGLGVVYAVGTDEQGRPCAYVKGVLQPNSKWGAASQEREGSFQQPQRMAESSKGDVVQKVHQLINRGWELFLDTRIRFRYKLIPLIGLAYVLSPLDFIPASLFGFVGVGDDIAAFLGSIWLFVKLAERQLVKDQAVKEDKIRFRKNRW